MVKLPDTVAACNRIRSDRRYARKVRKAKSVSVRLDLGEKCVVSSVVRLLFNKSTGCVSVAGMGLHVNGYDVYPGKHQKFLCTNQHAIDMLSKKREFNRINSLKRRALARQNLR